MNKNFDYRAYWERRISSHTDLRGVGHRRFDLEYNQWLYKTQRDCMDRLIELHHIEIPGKQVIDVGSGTGFYIDYFLQHGAKSIVGVDLTQASKQYLESKFSNETFFTADISDTPFPIEGPFDIVSAMGVLYHIVENDRFAQAVRNLCTLLAPGGFLFLTDALEKPFMPSAHHARLRDLTSYKRILEEYDLQVIELVPLYYFANRTFIPIVGPWLLNTLRLGKWLYRMDNYLRDKRVPNGSSLKIMLAQRKLEL